MLGELPDADPDPRSDPLTVLLAVIGAIALYLGNKHRPGSPRLADDTFTLLVYGVLPLAVAVGWSLRGRGVWLLGAGVTVLGKTLGWVLWGPESRKHLVLRPWLLLPSTLAAAALLLGSAWRGGADLRRWGLGWGDVAWWRPRLLVGLGAVAVFAGVAAAISPAMLAYYPNSALARGSWTGLLQAQLFALLYMIGWEFFYRGFLLFGLARRDPLLAVFFQALPFFLMHRGKPAVEMLSSFAGAVGLGWATLRGRSIWPAVLLHWTLLGVMDLIGFVVRAWAD